MNYNDCLGYNLGYCTLKCAKPESCKNFKKFDEWRHIPCKVGDRVYLLLKGCAEILDGDVQKLTFNHKGDLYVCIKRKQDNCYTTGNFKESSFGRTVFVNKADAIKVMMNE